MNKTYTYIVLIFLSLIFFINTKAVAVSADSIEILTQNMENNDKVTLLNELIIDNLYTNPVESENYAIESLKYSLETGNDSLIANSYYYLGLSYYFQDYWTLALDNFLKAINSNWGNTSNSFKARCTNNIGICYEYLGEYEKSASYYFETIATSEKQNNELLTARAQLNIGMLYIRMRNYEEAIKMLLNALPTLVKLDDKYNIINTYQNLFIAEGEVKNKDQSEFYFVKALSLASAENDSTKICEIQSDYGNLLQTVGKYIEAKPHLELALKYADSINNSATYYLIMLSQGKNEMYLENLDRAEILINKAYSKFKEYEANIWLTSVQLSLSRLYAKKGDFALSDKFQEEALAHEDELFNNRRLKSISEMEVKYKTEKKEQELAIQEFKLKSQGRTIIFIGIIAFLFAVALLIVLLSVKKIKNTNKELFERNQELSSRWNKLKNCDVEHIVNNGDSKIYKSISELMNQEMLFKNPELTVDVVSKKINSNTKYVSRAIKERTGMNFNTYINTHRIEEAKKTLLDPVHSTWSLDAVAENCGFNNPTTFYQNFKKSTGLTPATYRNIKDLN